jgi:hypothetical protein
MYRDILETTIDAAETIVQCTKHMKTIVDGNYIVYSETSPVVNLF